MFQPHDPFFACRKQAFWARWRTKGPWLTYIWELLDCTPSLWIAITIMGTISVQSTMAWGFQLRMPASVHPLIAGIPCILLELKIAAVTNCLALFWAYKCTLCSFEGFLPPCFTVINRLLSCPCIMLCILSDGPLSIRYRTRVSTHGRCLL